MSSAEKWSIADWIVQAQEEGKDVGDVLDLESLSMVNTSVTND